MSEKQSVPTILLLIPLVIFPIRLALLLFFPFDGGEGFVYGALIMLHCWILCDEFCNPPE